MEKVRGSFVNQPKTRVKATISGKSYTIIGRKSQQEMQSIVRVLQEQLDQITRVSDKLSTEEVALLAAINAISNQFEKQEEVVALKTLSKRTSLNNRSTQLQRKLSKTLLFQKALRLGALSEAMKSVMVLTLDH